MATLFSKFGMEVLLYGGVLLLFAAVHTKAQCPGGADEMKALYKKLLHDYNPVIRPNRNYSTPIDVLIQLHISFVLGLDTKHQLLYLRAFARIMWTDEYLQWDPKDHGCINRIVVPQNTIWKPDIILYSAANEHDKLGSETMLISVDSKGLTKWEPPFYLEGICKLDMSKYPFDINLCPVTISSWMIDNQSMQFRWPQDPVSIETMTPNGEYKVSSGGVTKEVFSYENEFFEIITFKLRLERRPLYIVVSLLVPVNLLAVLGIMSFIMPPEEPEKVAVSITILLSFTVFLAFIDNNIPPTSDNVSLLVVYISALLVLSFLSVVGNALVVTLKSNDEQMLHACKAMKAQEHYQIALASSYTNKPQGNTTATQGLLNADNRDSFPFDQAQVCAPGDVKDKCQIFYTRASKLNKAFLIISCFAFVFISFLMLALITV